MKRRYGDRYIMLCKAGCNKLMEHQTSALLAEVAHTQSLDSVLKPFPAVPTQQASLAERHCNSNTIVSYISCSLLNHKQKCCLD